MTPATKVVGPGCAPKSRPHTRRPLSTRRPSSRHQPNASKTRPEAPSGQDATITRGPAETKAKRTHTRPACPRSAHPHPQGHKAISTQDPHAQDGRTQQARGPSRHEPLQAKDPHREARRQRDQTPLPLSAQQPQGHSERGPHAHTSPDQHYLATTPNHDEASKATTTKQVPHVAIPHTATSHRMHVPIAPAHLGPDLAHKDTASEAPEERHHPQGT